MGKRGPKPQFDEALTPAQRQARYARGQQIRIKRERDTLKRLQIRLGEIVKLIEQGEPVAAVGGRLRAICDEIGEALNSSA